MRHELAMIQHCIAEIKDKGLETDAQYWVNEAWMRLDEEDRKIKKAERRRGQGTGVTGVTGVTEVTRVTRVARGYWLMVDGNG